MDRRKGTLRPCAGSVASPSLTRTNSEPKPGVCRIEEASGTVTAAAQNVNRDLRLTICTTQSDRTLFGGSIAIPSLQGCKAWFALVLASLVLALYTPFWSRALSPSLWPDCSLVICKDLGAGRCTGARGPAGAYPDHKVGEREPCHAPVITRGR